jgi:MarR family 2-MHQ and catechol resistance regulon transcriptional repressor
LQKIVTEPELEDEMKKDLPANRETREMLSIVRTFEVLNRYLEIELTKHGSSPARFAIMNAIVAHGGSMNPTAISKWLFRAKHSMTPMIKHLENIGFVNKKPSDKDRRSFDVVVTQKGWDATRRMTGIADEISHDALSCLTSEEKATLITLLKRLRKHLYEKMNY